MALERLHALALFGVPQNDLVVTPAAREKLAVKTPGDRQDPIAATFSNVREHICNGRLRLSPPELNTHTRLSPGERGETKKKSLANLRPSSVFRRSPFFGSHRMIFLSAPPLPFITCQVTVRMHAPSRTPLLLPLLLSHNLPTPRVR